jgi:hypothetical protein
MDTVALEMLIHECDDLLDDYYSFMNDLSQQLNTKKYKWCVEMNHELMNILRDMRIRRVPSSSVVELYQSPYPDLTNLDMEEWTFVSDRKYTVDRYLARGFCARDSLPRQPKPRSLDIEFFYKIGDAMMVEKVDSSDTRRSLLSIIPETMTAGTITLQGFTSSMERVHKRAKYSNGWLNAVRDIGFF